MGDISRELGPSAYLFVTPSFLRGVGRVADIRASYSWVSYNYSATGGRADLNAMRADAAALRADMRKVLHRVQEEVGRA